MAAAPRIAIVGGGLAGLAAAKALSVFGFAPRIFERASSLGEIGAGINISPQGVKALDAMGLGAAAREVANLWPGIFTRDMHTGQPLEFRDPKAAEAKFGAPNLTFHRADLMRVLASGVDPDRLHLDHRLTALDERAAGVHLAFANGASFEADVVIAADGIHSVVRRALYGADNPSYTGQMVWRALLKGSDVPHASMEPSGHVQWVGPGRHFFAYYLRGREVVNIVTQEDTEKWVDEGWSIPGDPDEMRASFPDPEPRFAALLAVVTECSKWGLFTRPLTGNWGRGRIQLIGDAAHAMLPNAGQGACQGFEDGYVLARWLDARRDDPAAALAEFRRIRIPRVHAVQRRSIANARFKHMHDRAARDAVYARGAAEPAEWIYGWEPERDWNTPSAVPAIE